MVLDLVLDEFDGDSREGIVSAPLCRHFMEGPLLHDGGGRQSAIRAIPDLASSTAAGPD